MFERKIVLIRVQSNGFRWKTCVFLKAFCMTRHVTFPDFAGIRPFKFSWKVPSSICLFKGNSENTRITCQICSKSTIKKPDRRNDLVLVSLLLPLNTFHILFWRLHCWILTSKCRVECFLIFITKCEDKKFLILCWLRLRVKLRYV